MQFVPSKQESLMSIFIFSRKWHLKLNILKIQNSLTSKQMELRLFMWEKFRKMNSQKMPSFNGQKAFTNGHKGLFSWNFWKMKNWHF